MTLLAEALAQKQENEAKGAIIKNIREQTLELVESSDDYRYKSLYRFLDRSKTLAVSLPTENQQEIEIVFSQGDTYIKGEYQGNEKTVTVTIPSLKRKLVLHENRTLLVNYASYKNPVENLQQMPIETLQSWQELVIEAKNQIS